MSGLGPESRAMFDRAHAGFEPSTADRKRISARLMAKIGAGAAVASSATATAAAKPASLGVAALLSGSTVKLVGTALIVGAIGAGEYLIVRAIGSSHPDHLPTASEPTTSASPPPLAPALAASAAQGDPAAIESPTIPTPTQPAAAPPRLASASPAVSSQPDLAEEIARLKAAQRAIRDGRPDQAMETLGPDSGQRTLDEEHAAMRVFALCRMGKVDESKAAAAEFLSRWPGSLHAPRVRTACSTPPRNE